MVGFGDSANAPSSAKMQYHMAGSLASQHARDVDDHTGKTGYPEGGTIHLASDL